MPSKPWRLPSLSRVSAMRHWEKKKRTPITISRTVLSYEQETFEQINFRQDQIADMRPATEPD